MIEKVNMMIVERPPGTKVFDKRRRPSRREKKIAKRGRVRKHSDFRKCTLRTMTNFGKLEFMSWGIPKKSG